MKKIIISILSVREKSVSVARLIVLHVWCPIAGTKLVSSSSLHFVNQAVQFSVAFLEDEKVVS